MNCSCSMMYSTVCDMRRPEAHRIDCPERLALQIASGQVSVASASTGADTVTYDRAEGGPSSVFLRMKIEAMNRVAAELRGMLAEAPKDDPDVAALLRDCALIEQVAHEMAHVIPASSLGRTVQSVAPLGDQHPPV